MRVYLGQTRSGAWIHMLKSYGFGECVSRGEFPPRRTPWFMDNGAFGDWLAGRGFNVAAYERDLGRMVASDLRPDFLVVPDIVAGGHESLHFSLSWVERLSNIAPLYFVVQDGMGEEIVPDLEPFSGLFVGGSLPWKLKTGAKWVQLARELGLRCHIGRVGTEKRVRWARRIGADSIDSSLPLFSEGNFRRFLRGFEDELTADLFEGAVP